LIIAAAVFDFLDGFTAVRLKQCSALGLQLDSLADVVSFGVAPSAILYIMCYMAGGGYLSYAAFVIAAFSALRLAKFNIDESQSDSFEGLPTPANALFFASCGYLYDNGSFHIPWWMMLATGFVMSLLLTSRIRMFSLKFKNFTLRDNTLRYIFAGGSAAAVTLFGVKAIPVVILAYIGISICADMASRTGNKS
jgi:CDP-diacylglycerol--serine O-phosphatidyltransferase